jgi:hypothetical protein
MQLVGCSHLIAYVFHQAKGDLEALQDANEELSFQVGALSKDLDLARKVGDWAETE